jgi:bifunctional non-homologous end joining protein LigD
LSVETRTIPLDYGDFEGTIPKGQYGGGTVQLWDRGYWIPKAIRTRAEARRPQVHLVGERLRAAGCWCA